MNPSVTPIWNPFKKGYLEDPYSAFRVFRETNPVHKGINGQWMVFRYEDAKFVLSDQRFKTLSVSDLIKGAGLHLLVPDGLQRLSDVSLRWILFLDAPIHNVVRGIVSKAWRSFDLKAAIEEIAKDVLNDLSQKPEPDIVRDLAIPIPPRVMCKLLGFPDEDHIALRTWSAAFGKVIEQFETLETLLDCSKKAEEFFRYAQKAVREKTAVPKDDLISKILIENQALQQPLETNEIISVISLLILAGNETLINLLGQSVLQLLLNPIEKDRWSNDASISSKAADELIRFISPAQFTTRVPTEDLSIRGTQIKEGERVMVSMAAANRDPDIFTEPDKLELTRQVNPHIGFGHGAHFCLGAAMAKTEIGIAIPALLERFPEIRLDPKRKFIWDTKFNTRGLKSLPVLLS
ncbi:MAG: cytochrome P450 [Pyrinomonadaceae bacterium]